MEKYTVTIAYAKNNTVKSKQYVRLTIKQVNKLERVYQQAQEKSLIKYLQFAKTINLYTVLLAYIKQGKIITRAFHNLTENKVNKLKAVYQRLQEQEKISSLMFSAI